MKSLATIATAESTLGVFKYTSTESWSSVLQIVFASIPEATERCLLVFAWAPGYREGGPKKLEAATHTLRDLRVGREVV